MSLNSVPIQDVNRDHLASLVEEAVAELRFVEYKRELPERSDSAKREFAADISSFANTAGGDIIFGVTEQGGPARPTRLRCGGHGRRDEPA